MNYFFVDAETDGLYGAFLSVAALVTDKTGNREDSFYAAVLPETVSVISPWVKENVVPYLCRAEQFYSTEYELLEAFWTFWTKHRETCIAIADVGYPVEARLFTQCVLHNLKEREWLGPFPLYDLSNFLVAAGIPPLSDRPQLSGLSLIPHDPFNDVLMAAAIWQKYAVKK